MLTRLSYNLSLKQTMIAAGGVAVSLLVPAAMSRIKILASLKKVYGIVGIIALALVLVICLLYTSRCV